VRSSPYFLAHPIGFLLVRRTIITSRCVEPFPNLALILPPPLLAVVAILRSRNASHDYSGIALIGATIPSTG